MSSDNNPLLQPQCEPPHAYLDVLRACTTNDLGEWVNIFAVGLAAIFAGISAACAWKANSTFKKQARLERFDRLIGDGFYEALNKATKEFRPVKSKLVPQALPDPQTPINGIRSIQNGALFTKCVETDDHLQHGNLLQDEYEKIDTCLQSLADTITQQSAGWHTRANKFVEDAEAGFKALRAVYNKARQEAKVD